MTSTSSSDVIKTHARPRGTARRLFDLSLFRGADFSVPSMNGENRENGKKRRFSGKPRPFFLSLFRGAGFSAPFPNGENRENGKKLTTADAPLSSYNIPPSDTLPERKKRPPAKIYADAARLPFAAMLPPGDKRRFFTLSLFGSGEDVVRIPAPNEKQKLFLKDTHKYVAFGGARGGGKSFAVRVKAVLLAAKYPGIKLLILRNTLQELRNNHIDPLLSLLGKRVSYSETKREIRFPNGSLIRFGYCACNSDLGQYQGSEWDAVFIDEATKFREEWFDALKVTLRGVNPFPKRMYLTCNPGGIGHSWVKRLFIDRAYKEGEDPDDYSFIKSLVTDNKALMKSDPDYLKRLSSLPPKLRRAWLEGDWNIFEGQFFEEFSDDPAHYEDRIKTHVISPFEIPPDWKVYRSFDWGFSKPFDVSWWAVDYEGRAYLILQFYGCTGVPDEGLKWPPDRVFAEIARIESEHRWLKGRLISGVADPAIFNRTVGESVAETADRYRIYFQRGDNTRVPGWMQVRSRLAFDSGGKPSIYFFSTCRHAIRTLKTLEFSPYDPEDLDTTGEDHFADSMRYFCMSRPIVPKPAPISEKAPESDPLDLRSGRKYPRYSY